MEKRRLTTYQYFEVLQLEWILANLRTRIYKRSKDKEYWNRVMENKRVKIENISERNRLPNIFTDRDLRDSIERRIFNEYTYPNFHYKDEEHKKTQGYWDLLCYYDIGVEVRFDYYEEPSVGVVIAYTPFEPKIKVKRKDNGDVVELDVNKVMRIL